MIINFLTAVAWMFAVYYFILIATVIYYTMVAPWTEPHIKGFMAATGPISICFLIAKYFM